MMNPVNSIIVSYKMCLYFSFYLIVGLTASRRLYLILGKGRPGGDIDRALISQADVGG